MKVIHNLTEYPSSLRNTVATLGNFDGVHRGHQKIFQALLDEAATRSAQALVVTFFPHPLKVLAPARAPRAITTLEERLRLVEACGVPLVLCLPFTVELARVAPADFVRDTLVDGLGVRMILVGEDFRFGRNREGDIHLLRRMGKEFGFDVRMIRPLRIGGEQVSSTRIRQLIQEGRVRESAQLLGRYYGFAGTVVRGDGRGRTLGIPTANLQTDSELLPPKGVYAVLTRLGDRRLPGVANLGTKPTFSGQSFAIEVHLFDFDEDLYGHSLRVEFVERLRDERRFESVQGLMEQMGRDLLEARARLDPRCLPVLEEQKG